jgi:hypothetical protein
MAVSATQEGSMAIGISSRPMQRVPAEAPAEPFAVSRAARRGAASTVAARRYEHRLAGQAADLRADGGNLEHLMAASLRDFSSSVINYVR